MENRHHLRIKRHYSIVAHGPDVVELRAGVWNPVSFTLTDESGSGRLFRVLSGLDGSVSNAELAKRNGVARGEVEGLIDHLHQLGVVESGASNSLDYYLDQLAPGMAGPPQGTRRSVLLSGDADLTSLVKNHLEASLPDHPIAEVPLEERPFSSLVEADPSWLRDGMKFHEKIEAFSGWRDHFLVFIARTIHPEVLRRLNRVALEIGVPWLHAAIDGPFLFVGPTFVPNRGPCYGCFETRVTMNLRESAGYQRYKSALVEGKIQHRTPPLEPAVAGLLAAHVALETLNFVLTGCSFTRNRVLSIYLPAMEFSFNEVLRLSGCQDCGPAGERDEKQLYFDMRALLNGQAAAS